jgi:HlyD family secretion protein
MKVKHMAIFVILVLMLWTSAACDMPSTGASDASPAPTPPPPLAAAQTTRTSIVSAEGEVVPVKQATPSFEVAGRLTELLVSEGDTVEAGQTVARLAQTDWQQRVDEAEAALELARAQLAQARAGARSEEIMAAQEALAAAQAGVSTARANLTSAQAELARLEAGATPEELLIAKADMDSAAAALELAQSEYDKIAWQSGLGATGQAMSLRQASNDYERAKASYQALVKGATAEELDIARAAIEAARAQIEVAQAQAGQAKAQLDLLLAGPAAETIAVAEAQVQQAQTALQGVKTALEKTVLVAPLSGTVGDVMFEEGETVMAGAPVMVIGDLSALQVETNDLSEVDIVEVAVGQEVEVSVDAMPYLELRGRVSEISPMAEEQHGDIVYKVTIDLEEGAAASLRWGMTAYVDILVGE